MKFPLPSILLTMIMASSCGKNVSSSKNSGPTSETETYSSSVKDSYHLIHNGCDTGKKEFHAPTKAEVKGELCNALQDNSFNNWCAESLRKSYFENKCADMIWNPY